MRHKAISMLALTLVLALAAGTALLAQDTSSTTTGRITNVDASGNTMTVTTAGGESETFSTDAQSMYMANGRTISLQTLKVGDQVTITYRISGNTKTAEHVDVVSNDTGTAPSPSATTGTYHSPSGTTAGTDATGRTYDSDTYRNSPNADTYKATGSTYDRDHDMNATRDKNLPRSGSTLPLVGLAGALCGGAALTLAGLRRYAS